MTFDKIMGWVMILTVLAGLVLEVGGYMVPEFYRRSWAMFPVLAIGLYLAFVDDPPNGAT